MTATVQGVRAGTPWTLLRNTMSNERSEARRYWGSKGADNTLSRSWSLMGKRRRGKINRRLGKAQAQGGRNDGPA